MADEDLGADIDDESGVSQTPSKSGLGGVLPTILKYVALALGAIILICK